MDPATFMKDRTQRLLLYPILFAVTLAYIEICRWTVNGVDVIDIGSSASGRATLNVIVGGLFFWRVNSELTANWTLPHAERLYPAAYTILRMLLFPVCLLFGRIIFTYLPPLYDPTIGCIFGAVLYGFYFAFGMPAPKPPPPSDRPLRGTTLLNHDDAESLAAALARETADPDVSWAGITLPSTAAELNFCVVGTKGSGKTLMMQGLMRTVLPSISRGRDRRALIYDVKTEWLSFLYGIGLAESIRILNPLDTRCYAWDVANDLKSLAEADQFGQVLVPVHDQDRNPFFTEAARSLIAGIVKTLMLTAGPRGDVPARWTLRDLALIAGHPSRLRWVLLKKAKGTIIRDLVPQFLKAMETYHNIISSIALAVVPLQVTAGIWERLPPGRRISLRSWATHGDTILVMSQAPMYEKPLAALNRVMFKFISDTAISDPGKHEHENRFWFFCDELKEAGNLDGLAKILNDGRSKGIRAAIGFQDIEGFRHEYGERLANELPTACSNLSFLRIESPFTQKWASETIGPIQIKRVTTSSGTGVDSQGRTTTNEGQNEQVVIEDAVLTSEFKSLPLSKNGMVAGYHHIPELGGVVQNCVHYEFADKDETLNFSPRYDSIEEQLPKPWTREDAERLWPGDTFPDSLFEEPEEESADGATAATVPLKRPKDHGASPLDSFGRLEVD